MIKINLKNSPKPTFKQIAMFLIGVGLIVIVVMMGIEFKRTREDLNKLKNPFYFSQLQSELTNRTLNTLSEIMILPEGTPSIVNIADISQLKKENPEFYKNAQIGDIILIYPQIAIIMRMDKDNKPKIINIAPVIEQQITPTPQVQI